jgi:MoaA/NifB/PqqE/SkfB family radical SAM enzyme
VSKFNALPLLLTVPYKIAMHEPFALQVDITEKCNLRCHHCYFFKQPHRGELTDDEWKNRLRGYRQNGYVAIAYCGGEPLLRAELLNEVRQFFPIHWIATNGTCPIPSHFNMVYVSLDGYCKYHDLQRGKEGLYSQVRAQIESSANQHIVIGCCITNMTKDSLSDLVKDVAHLNVLGIIFNFYTPSIGEGSDLCLSLPERNRTINQLMILKQEYGDFIRCTSGLLERMRVAPVPERCRITKIITALDARGERKNACAIMGDCGRCGALPYYLLESARLRSIRDVKTEIRMLNFLRMIL